MHRPFSLACQVPSRTHKQEINQPLAPYSTLCGVKKLLGGYLLDKRSITVTARSLYQNLSPQSGAAHTSSTLFKPTRGCCYISRDA